MRKPFYGRGERRKVASARITVDSAITPADTFDAYFRERHARTDTVGNDSVYWFGDVAIFVKNRSDRIELAVYSHDDKVSSGAIRQLVQGLSAREVPRYGPLEASP